MNRVGEYKNFIRSSLILLSIISLSMLSLAISPHGNGIEDICGQIGAQEDCIPQEEIKSGTPVTELTCVGDFNSQCRKVGINFAVTGVNNSEIDRAANLNMGYTLNIANGPADVGIIADNFNYAMARKITPILRICVGHSCAFSDPSSYVTFLLDLSNRTGNRPFYAIAGPNEPLTEVWLGGTEGDPNSVAPLVASYMNSVINEYNGRKGSSQVMLMTPVFNATNPAIGEFIDVMKQSGANFSGVQAIGLNTYNLNSGRMTAFLNTIKNKNISPGRPYIITEAGQYEVDQGVPRSQGLTNLRSELDSLKNDPEVKAILLFSSFGTNTDARFDFNVFTQDEFEYLLTVQCIESRLACN